MQTAPLAKATFYYGLVCFGVLTGCFFLLPLLFPRIFCEAAWTVWKEVVAVGVPLIFRTVAKYKRRFAASHL